MTDADIVERVFRDHQVDTCSTSPLTPADGLRRCIRRFNCTNNLIGSMTLVNAAVDYGVKCCVFTSSTAVSGRRRCQ